ncbi:type II restriction endonuclease [Clostridioides difficile]
MNFIEKFNEKIEKGNINWDVKGLLRDENTIITLGSDSKLIGRIFELITYQLLEEICKDNDYILEPSQSQTVYPDYTLIKKDANKEKLSDKIAVDIKTTYRQYKKDGSIKKIGFTLGAYGSFIRDGKKNIAYLFKEYNKHYVICFIYDRNNNATEGKMVDIEKLDDLEVPYSNVTVFAQEKYLIVGDKPGSGNTENIGSFKTDNIGDLINGNGPFGYLGENVYLDYWKNYPRHREKHKVYTCLTEYFKWLEQQGKCTNSLKERYEEWENSLKNK